MALTARRSNQLTPELSLAQAISEYEALLTGDVKARFRTYRSRQPPGIVEVATLTAELNEKGKDTHFCYGSRFQKFLEFAQRFTGVLNTIISGSQQPIASGAWGVVRLSLEIASGLNVFFEELSKIFLEIGRACPCYEEYGMLLEDHPPLQAALCEYYILVVTMCTSVVKFSQKPPLHQLGSTIFRSYDSEFGPVRTELASLSCHIREQVMLASTKIATTEQQKASNERRLTAKFRTKQNKDLQQVQRLLYRQRRIKFLESLSASDLHRTSYRQARKAGNTTWLLKEPDYLHWKSTKEKCTLLVEGKLGSGKTVLTSNVIDDIILEGTGGLLVYFFCRPEHISSCKAREALGSITRQLIELSNTELRLDIMETSYPDLEDLIELLAKLLPQHARYTILLDGLDECTPQERNYLLQSLVAVMTKVPEAVFKTFLSCRNDALDIPQKFPVNLRIATMNNSEDITNYVKSSIVSLVRDNRLHVSGRRTIELIESALISGANQMFLWVKLQLETLCMLQSDAEILSALEELPIDLPETYNRILKRLKESRHSIVTVADIYRIVVGARVPLNVDELRMMLSITPGDKRWIPSKIPNDIISSIYLGGSLLFIDEETETVHFAHQSVVKFLDSTDLDSTVSNFKTDPRDADLYVGILCMTYLCLDIFSSSLTKSKPDYIKDSRYETQIPATVIQNSLPDYSIFKKIIKPWNAATRPSINCREVLEAAYERKIHLSQDQRYALIPYALENWLIQTMQLTPDISVLPWDLFMSIIQGDIDLESRFPGTSHQIPNSGWDLNHLGLILARDHRSFSERGSIPTESLLAIVPYLREGDFNTFDAYIHRKDVPQWAGFLIPLILSGNVLQTMRYIHQGQGVNPETEKYYFGVHNNLAWSKQSQETLSKLVSISFPLRDEVTKSYHDLKKINNDLRRSIWARISNRYIQSNSVGYIFTNPLYFAIAAGQEKIAMKFVRHATEGYHFTRYNSFLGVVRSDPYYLLCIAIAWRRRDTAYYILKRIKLYNPKKSIHTLYENVRYDFKHCEILFRTWVPFWPFGLMNLKGQKSPLLGSDAVTNQENTQGSIKPPAEGGDLSSDDVFNVLRRISKERSELTPMTQNPGITSYEVSIRDIITDDFYYELFRFTYERELAFHGSR